MHEVLAAGLRAARDLRRADILWQALWPPLLSFVLWAAVAYVAWMPLSARLLAHLPQRSWFDWLGPWLVHAALALTFAPLIYVTTLLLVALFALPRMMAIVAGRDYPDLSRQVTAGAALRASVANTLAAVAVFIVGWLLCLPLLLVPGGLLVLPLLWAAWLNQRTFRVDVLAEHATPDERTAAIRAQGSSLWAAGLVAALLAHVPLLNVLAPAFAALLFSHLGLSALRRVRDRQGIVIVSPALPPAGRK